MSPRRFAATLALIGSIAVVVGALLFQYVGGLQPCELCLLERWPYYISILLLIAALLLGARGRLAVVLIAIVPLLFAAGSALAFYHVGVEHHWFAGPTACTSFGTTAHTVAELKAQIMGLQPIRCDEVQWSLFHVSLAGWNFLASLGLMAITLHAVRARGRTRRL